MWESVLGRRSLRLLCDCRKGSPGLWVLKQHHLLENPYILPGWACLSVMPCSAIVWEQPVWSVALVWKQSREAAFGGRALANYSPNGSKFEQHIFIAALGVCTTKQTFWHSGGGWWIRALSWRRQQLFGFEIDKMGGIIEKGPRLGRVTGWMVSWLIPSWAELEPGRELQQTSVMVDEPPKVDMRT